MLIAEWLKQREMEIQEDVRRTCIDPAGKAHPITDGVVNPIRYAEASTRILWILKEPWCNQDGTGGGWSLTELISSMSADRATGQTFTTIARAAFGILNDKRDGAEIPNVRSRPEVLSQIFKDLELTESPHGSPLRPVLPAQRSS